MANNGPHDFSDRTLRDDAHLQRGMVNAGFIFFTLAILATLIFGRFVCGWGCHILALQDFCGWLLKKMRYHAEAVSLAALDLRSAHRRALHVRLADRLSFLQH